MTAAATMTSSISRRVHARSSATQSTTTNNNDEPQVTVVEVGPRDGLQNEKATPLTVEQRIRLVQLLAAAGCRKMEVGSFVSPEWVPAMAHSDLVYRELAQLRRRRQRTTTTDDDATHKNALVGTTLSCLVPNVKGMERALAVMDPQKEEEADDEIAIFAAASETFSQKVCMCVFVYALVRRLM